MLRSHRNPGSAALFAALSMLITAGVVRAADEKATQAQTSVKTTAASKSEARPDRAEVALRQRPYLVRVRWTFRDDSMWDARYRDEFRQQLALLVDRQFGALWEADFAETNSLQPPTRDALDRWTAQDAAPLAEDADKLILLVIERHGSRIDVAGREWDATARQLSTTVSNETWERRTVADAAGEVIGRVFHPILSIEGLAGETVSLQLQAGDFPSGDPDRPQLREGDILAAFLRHLEKDRTLRQVQPLPWTYLVVEKVDGTAVTARLNTGVRTPLGAKRRRNIEMMAIAVRPGFERTQLTLLPRSRPDRPLAGSPVVVTTQRPNPTGEAPRPAAEAKPGNAKPPIENAEAEKPEAAKPKGDPPVRLLTNRLGTITLAADPTHRMVWLTVLSGDAVLARVPYVPGLEPRATLELPDDTLRLSVEADLDLLKDRLVDIVAKRAVLISRSRSLARAGDIKAARALVPEIEALPGPAVFERESNAIRAPALEEVQAKKDRAGELRIRQLIDDTMLLVRRYLDADKVSALKEELDELEKETAAAGAQKSR